MPIAGAEIAHDDVSNFCFRKSVGGADLLDRYGDAELAEVQETLEGELAARIEDGAAWLDHPPCP